jgi:hypothetical protein
MTEEVRPPLSTSEPREAPSSPPSAHLLRPRSAATSSIEEEVWARVIVRISATGNTEIKTLLSKAGERGAQ